MKKQNAFLRLLCALLATLMLVGMLSACNEGTPAPTDPTEAPIINPTEDPTELPTEGGDPTIPEDPTEEPGGATEDPDSSIMDGDDHIQIPW